MVNQDTDWNQVQQAITEAEAQTESEIVVTVVRRSGDYGHLPWFVGVFAFALLLLGHVDALVYHYVIPFEWPSWLSLVVVVIVSRFLGLAICRFAVVIRAFSSAATLDRWIELRAEVEFFEKIYGHTKSNTGVLIFVSLTERRAIILADKPVMDKMEAGFFDGLMSNLLHSIGGQDLVGGLAKTVFDLGEVLKVALPIKSDDVNELDNRVIFKEQ